MQFYCIKQILKNKAIENISSYWRNADFQRLFLIILTKQEVDFSDLYIVLITTIQLENLPLEFLKYFNYFSSYWQKKQFSAAILHFPHKTGSRFIEPLFFTNHYYRT